MMYSLGYINKKNNNIYLNHYIENLKYIETINRVYYQIKSIYNYTIQSNKDLHTQQLLNRIL